MKKYLLIVAALIGLVMVSKAKAIPPFTAPVTPSGNIYPPEYGGFGYSTSNFSVNGGTFTGYSVISGINFSTGTVDDWVDIFETTATINVSSITAISNPHASRVLRIFNVGNSTGTGPAAFARGFSPAGSIFVGGKGGWMWKPRDGSNPGITLFYIGGKQWDNGK